ncbi:MAG: YfhO family protein, partial [Clostridia bacterium]|nr:YfhO family protein [Clostridia bacterium]
YIRRFVHRPQSAMLGGLLYAFSGFSVYNIFFNHFHEAIVFFPLLLLALEMFITENRRGWLALAVFICALSNYFFFFGMAVFCIIYWFIRTVSGCWKQKVGRFFLMVLEVVIGGLMACAVLLPTVFALMQNNRLDNFLYGWNAFLYSNEQRYLYILQCFFFPPDLPARPIFFADANAKWSSVSGWLPLVGMTGVIAWLQYKRGHWLRRMICVLGFMAAVPLLNSVFYMFNEAYYARWFYMIVLMMSLASVMALEDHSIPVNKSFRWAAGITLAFTLAIGLYPAGLNELGEISRFGLFTADSADSTTFKTRFWVTVIIAVTALVVFRLLMVFIKRKPKFFYGMAIGCVCIFSMLYSFYFIACGKTHSYDEHSVMIGQLLEGEMDLPGEKDDYRIDVYDGVDNTGMFLDYDSINAFHSIVPGSVTEFYEWVGEERGVASRPTVQTYAIRSLLSVRYVLDPTTGDDFTNSYGDPKMPGFELIRNDMNGFAIWENKNYIPYGFTYDYYMTEEQAGYYGENNRHLMLLKAMLLSPEQIAKYSDLLTNIAKDYIVGNELDVEGGFNLNRQDIDFSDETYAADCAARRENCATSFERDNKGFTATITLEKDNLVFFSVPHEEGWSATVNGKAVDVEKVNGGFMAVAVPKGSSTIRFDYTTPGLGYGIILSIGGVGLLLIYLLIVFISRKVRHYSRPALAENWPEISELRESWAKSDEIDLKFQYLLEHDIDYDEEIQLNNEFRERKLHRFDKESNSEGFVIDLGAFDASANRFSAESFAPAEISAEEENKDE